MTFRIASRQLQVAADPAPERNLNIQQALADKTISHGDPSLFDSVQFRTFKLLSRHD